MFPCSVWAAELTQDGCENSTAGSGDCGWDPSAGKDEVGILGCSCCAGGSSVGIWEPLILNPAVDLW